MSLFSFDIEKSYPQLKNNISLLAVSGGVDSIVLAHLFSKTKFKFIIAHCNYGLRNKESENDSFLVKKIANSYNVDFFIKKLDTLQYSKKNKCSIQMAAREIRYNWFEELLIENNISNIVTGHHLNDQLETFLINLGRGSGIEGLIGIPESSRLVRPLLKFTKEEISNYAEQNKLKWNEDKSNLKNDYLRNSIRNLVVPELKKIMPDIEQNFKKTIYHIGSANTALNNQIGLFKKTFFKQTQTGIKIKLNDLEKIKPKEFFLHSIFKEYGFISSFELNKLINSSPGKLISSELFELLRDRDCLILREKLESSQKTYKINLIPQKLNSPFNIEISLKPFPDIINSIKVDPSLLNSTLEIKKSYPGAFFYPIGMTGRKKISKYFKDEKFSKFEKERQWILTSNNMIVWIIGKRADRRFVTNINSNKRMYIRIDP